MKTCRKIAQHKIFMLLLISSFLFFSCGKEEMSSSTDNPAAKQISASVAKLGRTLTGEELFINIVYADGILADAVPAIASISNIHQLASKDLVDYRKNETESIAYLKSLSAGYFSNFATQIYSKDPEKISYTVKKAVEDLMPFINSKLAVNGLSFDVIKSNIVKDANGQVNIAKTQSEMKAMCAVWVIGLVAVAVVLLAVVAIATVVGPSDPLHLTGGLTLDAISVQVADAL